MGWSAGSYIAHKIASAFFEVARVTDEQAILFYRAVIRSLEDEDCDTIPEVWECHGFKDPRFKKAWALENPDAAAEIAEEAQEEAFDNLILSAEKAANALRGMLLTPPAKLDLGSMQQCIRETVEKLDRSTEAANDARLQ